MLFISSAFTFEIVYSKEFGCSMWAIRCWVKQADRDKDGGDGGLRSSEREELRQLKHENRQCVKNGRFSQKPRPGLHGKTSRYRSDLRIRDGQPGRLFGADDVPTAGRIDERLLRLECTSDVRLSQDGFDANGQNSCDSPALELGVWIADDPCGIIRRPRYSRRTKTGCTADACSAFARRLSTPFRRHHGSRRCAEAGNRSGGSRVLC